ncbi:MAG: hypothetical protein P4L53_08360 [Candidatus Obscuribacterales bacterium]|nr:hypothetical protein [Candidatus Obscuribacterales bacterium]
MTTSALGCMTVEHFDGSTGKSVLISQISITTLAQLLFSVLEMNLETEFDGFACASPLQSSITS